MAERLRRKVHLCAITFNKNICWCKYNKDVNYVGYETSRKCHLLANMNKKHFTFGFGFKNKVANMSKVSVENYVMADCVIGQGYVEKLSKTILCNTL